MEDYNDPAALETHDEDMLKASIERWRNEVKPSDLEASQQRRTGIENDYWVWAQR
jgi:hypothetical protein